nr:MAG TPA: hypothetical protein [Caudoviricetes sp.]
MPVSVKKNRRETVESQYQQKHNFHTIKQEVNQMAVIKEIKNGSGGVIRIHDDYYWLDGCQCRTGNLQWRCRS